MKKWFALVLLIAAPDLLACTDGSLVRVFFYNCAVAQEDKPVAVRIGGQNGEQLTLKYVAKYTWEGELKKIPATDKSEIEVDGNPAICCKPAKIAPLPRPSRDCAVEYVVSCDVRSPAGWTLVASSDLPNEVTFEFESEHPDNFGKRACTPAGVLKDKTSIQNLGQYDVVNVTVKRNKLFLVTFPVSFNSFTQPALPKSRDELVQAIDTEQNGGKQSNVSSVELKELRKAALPPNGIVVVKR